MDLAVENIKDILFKKDDNVEFIQQLNNTLRKLIQNDSLFIDGKRISPQLWECKWLNNDSVSGYPKGYAVWINTNSYESVFAANRQHIFDYAQNNPVLRQMLDQLDPEDSKAIDQLLMSAMVGSASSMVPAIYFLGDMSDHVQIRISTVDNNKTYPDDDSCWKDFYIRSTFEDNCKLLEETAISCFTDAFSQHVDKFHLEGIDEDILNSMGFFKKSPILDLRNIQLQNFYDHTYCTEMDGFDFVKAWKTNEDKTQWCRIWNSGYVEQGGFAENDGSGLIRVSFMASYNYPIGAKFYQSGYEAYVDGQLCAYCGDEMSGSLPAAKRYIVTVTPEMKDDAEYAYPSKPNVIGNSKIYACVDVTKLDNDGFSFVNVDQDKKLYSRYSWHVAGYRT